MTAPGRILVVDDTEATRYLVSRLLRANGHQVIEAATGQRGLQLALEQQPDVMVLDVKLPDVHGFEVARQIKADPRTASIAVLHLSATFTGAEARAQGLIGGADAYLTHPVEGQVLSATVDALLRLRASERREHEARERAEANEARLRQLADERERLLLELQRGAAERDALIARLQEEDRRKTEFLAVLSHELRNPLAPIRNSVYVLERAAPGGEQARRAKEVIERQTAQLTRLVDDLLDVTRIARGKVRLQTEPVDLASVARAVADDMREVFARRGVEFALELESGPLVVEGDRARLGQAVANLLQNAAKFSPAGGAAELRLCREDGHAVVRVTDNGVGIHPEMLPHVFEPFVQADRTLDRSEGGLGLGLALVKSLVELHHGTVTAESAGLGRGAAFTLRLPLAGEGGAHEAARERASAGAEGRRVLVVEDNDDAARSLAEVLELSGHTVEVATTGGEALEAARAFRPQVVLCDVGLPGLNGYQVAAALRADPALSGVTLVALSGYALQEDVEKARQAGFDHHLAKPPDLARLQQLIAAP